MSILSHKEETHTEELLSQFLTQITQKNFIFLTSNDVYPHSYQTPKKALKDKKTDAYKPLERN